MTSFEELCARLESMDDDSFNENFNALSVRVLDALTAITNDSNKAVSAYLNFILASVSADGSLTEDEFALIKPLFDQTAGHDVSYAEGLKMFKELGLDDPTEIQAIVDDMADIIGLVSPEIKDDIVLLSLMVCAIDRKISDEEKEWIQQLVEPLTVEVDPVQFIDSFLEAAGCFTLATVDDGQPRMRVLGFKTVLDGRIYFAVGSFKDVCAQLKKHPRCEILAYAQDKFIRWDGTAVFNDDQRLAMALGAAMPEIAQMYIDNGLSFAFFTLVDGTAEVVGADNSKTKLF